jgi:hypothetical protein
MKENLTYLRDNLFRTASYAHDVADTFKRMGDKERSDEFRRIGTFIYSDAEELNGVCDEFGVVRE